MDGMNITDEEIINILKDHISDEYWGMNDFELILNRAKPLTITDYEGKTHYCYEFPCSLVTITLDRDGNFVDAAPE